MENSYRLLYNNIHIRTHETVPLRFHLIQYELGGHNSPKYCQEQEEVA